MPANMPLQAESDSNAITPERIDVLLWLTDICIFNSCYSSLLPAISATEGCFSALHAIEMSAAMESDKIVVDFMSVLDFEISCCKITLRFEARQYSDFGIFFWLLSSPFTIFGYCLFGGK